MTVLRTTYGLVRIIMSISNIWADKTFAFFLQMEIESGLAIDFNIKDILDLVFDS